MRGLFYFALLSGIAMHLQGGEWPSIAVDFESMETGRFEKELVREHFGEVDWASLEDRAEVRDEAGDKFLEVLYPRGGVASDESGAQFVVVLEPSRYATLRYRFRPASGFPFVKGGKLPGLTAGGSQFTGGRRPGKEGGWSARYMWRREGVLELYFYHPGMKEKYGERHDLGTTLIPGEWIDIEQRIDTGDPGKRNGVIEVEVNGVTKLRLDGLELHGTKYGPVDTFFFSTFYGGNSSSWAPSEDTTISFDDFVISPEKPSFSGE